MGKIRSNYRKTQRLTLNAIIFVFTVETIKNTASI